MQFSKKFLFINFLILFEILLFINLSSQNRSLSKGNPPSPCSICGGTDDRIPSFNNAIGRIVRGDVVVGTAWATKNNKFVTAGHCFENTNNLVLEFNVPNSTSGGVIQHSGDADRYTIDIGSIAKQDVRDWQGNPIEGKDWAVFSVYANSITGKYPIEQYGSYLKITRKNNPTNIRITGYGTDDGSSNYIQQTSVGSFSSYNVTNNALYYNTDTQGGNSGSPIIDEATGYAVGVHTQGYCPSFPNGGTSLSNSTFYNALGLVDITIDQYTASGSQMTGSTLNLWEGSSFIGYPILSSLFNFNKNSVQIFKASQSLYNSTEKFYNWGSSSQIINHNTFTIDGSTNTIASYFGLVASGDLTINSFLPETNVYRGNVEFKDPWLYDYQDAGYGNNYRNRGTNGIFYSYATPLVLNINTTTSGGIHYNGIFLNQSGPGQNWNPPYYTVHTTQTQSVNFGGSIGTRTCYFQNWSTTNATLQNANTNETPIVFTSSGAVVTANLKGHLISSVTTGLSTTSQRKIVADSYNYLHMVYESMGSVWYSRSTDAGATWSAEQKVNIAGSNAKCPSIACSNDGYDLIYITYQSDVDDLGWATPSILLAQYRLGSFRWRSLVDYISAYTYNANSVVTALNGYVFVIHKPTSSTAFTGKEFAINTSYNVSAVYSRGNVPNTDANSTSPSLTVYGSGGGKYYLAYQQGTTEVKYFGWGINSAYGSQESATISTGSGATSALYPSISQNVGNIIVSWTGNVPSTTNCFIRRRPYGGSWSTFQQVGSFMNYTNNNTKSGTTEDAVIGWWDTYGNRTQFIKLVSGVYGTVTTLPSTGLFHISNGTSFSAMKAVIFNSGGSAPYAVNPLTYNFLTLQKESTNPDLVFGRKAVISIGKTEIVYYLENIKLDGENILFSDFNTAAQIKTTDDLNNVLTTDKFSLNKESKLQFSSIYYWVSTVLDDAVKNENLKFNFHTELISANDNKPVGKFRDLWIDKNNINDSGKVNFNIDCSNIKEGEYYLMIVADNAGNTNAEYYVSDIQYEKTDGLPKGTSEEISFSGNAIVKSYELFQNYPNPFNPTTIINYQMPKAGRVTLKIYDVLGKEVATLVDERKDEGKYSIEFNGSNLTSGIYFYELRTNEFVTTKKMLLVK